jgi:PAS domain S-box-containing protein
MDLSERRQAAAQLRESEQRYRGVLSSMMEGCQIVDYDWRYIYVNDAAARQGRRPAEELLMQRMPEVYPGIENTGMFAVLEDCMRRRLSRRIENEFIFPDGSSGWFELSIQPVPEGLFLLSMDITDRKLAEAELKASEEKYRSLFDGVPDGVYRTTPEGRFLAANPALVHMLGYDAVEQLQQVDIRDLYMDPDERGSLMELLDASSEVRNLEIRLRRRDGSPLVCLNNGKAIRDEAGRLLYFEGTLTDITREKQAQERIQQQLNRISALREVDRLISTSLDLRLTMKQILSQVERQLGADASASLILDPDLNTLNYLAAQGLPEKAVTRSGLRLGRGLAGRVAMDRRLVHYPNLRHIAAEIPEAGPLVEAGFVEYYGVPLTSRGQLKGVLEVFKRAAHAADPDWLEYLETLAGQAAIAIDSIQMFDGLNRSNLELAQAYDATIEGWSRALDLRDRETEGHTQRVTRLTLELARVAGLSEKELTGIRWGAQLHDIGKMAIPDSILLKEGALTEEEWVLMKEHPVFAQEMLAPIRYLHAALDIPLHHHEKWDGTGYPHGLKGEQIPLAARLFAIVDIWDALRSDRPYREGWSLEKALEHLQGLSGTHLDPKVVDLFLESKVYELDLPEE